MSEQADTLNEDAAIDIQRAMRMLKRTTDLEKKNIQTRQYSTSVMVEKIRGFIEEEAQCY